MLNLRFQRTCPQCLVRIQLKPVAVMNHGMGMYHVQLVLEMYGEWALIMDFTLPKRDRVVTKVTITKTGGGSTPKP